MLIFCGVCMAKDEVVRIADIEVYPQYIKEYEAMASEIAETSVREEPGVVVLFPTRVKRDSCKFRIVEIYANEEAYQFHIKTKHFKKYKEGTLHMVKSLDLVDVTPMNPKGMTQIFKKQK